MGGSLVCERSSRRRGSHVCTTRPHEDPPVLLHRDAAHLNEFNFQIVEVVVVERELTLQGPIREALVLLQPLHDLCKDLFEGHRLPPLRVEFFSGVSLRGPILPELRLGLHVGQQARCEKAFS
jgi:hypothetical protein